MPAKSKRGGAGRGQGRKVVQPAPEAIDPREVIRKMRAHLEAKPAQKIPVLLAREALALIEQEYNEPIIL